MTQTQPTVVVLAAGQSSRFKGTQHKLEQALNGSSVLGTTLSHVRASGLPVVLVATQPIAAHAHRWLPARDIVTLSDEQARRGMGSSIAAGVSHTGSSAGWLILPADMPLVRARSLRAVAAALATHPVVYAQYRGRRGHPVGLAAELYSELVLLSGDEGARRIVARYPVHGEEVDDPGVLMDIDTVEDLQLVQSRMAAGGLPSAAA